MDKLQVISQIIFDGELMIFMTMTLGLRIGYNKVNLELTKRVFFIRGLPYLMVVCSLVHKEATFFIDYNYVMYTNYVYN